MDPLVIGIFPNPESCIRYVSYVLMEIDEDWHTGRRYIRMDYLEENEVEEEFMEELQNVKEGSKLNEELAAQ